MGGATSCVAVGNGVEPPRLVLDAGTGLMRLSTLLAGRPFVGTILISHLHWDHTHGLPFFDAGLQPGNSVRVLMPTDGTDAEELLSRGLSPPHFPVRPRELGATGRSRRSSRAGRALRATTCSSRRSRTRAAAPSASG